MYKKVAKSIKNPYGIEETNISSISRPMVLFSVPFSNMKSINGYLSNLLYLLRLRNSRGINIGLDVSDVPFDIYSEIKFEPDTLSRFFVDANKNDKESLMRLFRNINIVSYCDGNNRILPVIENIHEQLRSNGFNEQDISELMSQISVLQVVDNLGEDGETFPYVTTNTVHIKQDDANPYWIEEDMDVKDGEFSKASVKRVKRNKQLLLVEEFGEGALEIGEEHTFSKDYLKFPVMNALMSICLVESMASSLKGERISIGYYKEAIHYVLGKAHEYEESLGKDLDSLTKEELEAFRKYMMDSITEYIKDKYNIKEVDTSLIKEKVIREEKIKEIAIDVSIINTSGIVNTIKSILEYKDDDLDEERKIRIANSFRNMSVKEIIEYLYSKLIKEVDIIVKKIENVNFKSEVNEELGIELTEWKKDQISRIYSLLDNEELKELLEKCNLRIPDNKSFVA